MTQDINALDQARALLDSILDMVERYNNDDTRDDAGEEIQQDPLEVSYRCANWATFDRYGANGLEPDEYRILLCTGGPAVQIVGDYDKDAGGPQNARIQFQDWFTPWCDLPGSSGVDAVFEFAKLITGD